MFAKKSLGQNFLKLKSAIRNAADAARLSAGDMVLEIGPGRGALTEELLARAGKVIALEKDADLIPFLKEKFASEISSGKFELLNSDALSYIPTHHSLQTTHYKLVANIPYYITGEILRKYLTENYQPSLMVLMVQKEVADRIVARDGKESLLSMSVKAYGKPKYIETVKARFFSPAPKVDSALILIDEISRDFFSDIKEDDFFKMLHDGFAQKRKKLAGNLKNAGRGPADAIKKIMESCGINPNARAENLSVEDWKRLITRMKKESGI